MKKARIIQSNLIDEKIYTLLGLREMLLKS